MKKDGLEIVKKMTLNLLNTTVMNTKYGILNRIIPNSLYEIQINASNSKGFVLSNKIEVETSKSGPDYLAAVELVYSNSSSLKIEWSPPLLSNSEDQLFSYELVYRKKIVWNEFGPITEPDYEDKIISLFSNRILASFFVLNNLIPFTAYSFRLTASNFYGQTTSVWSEDFYTSESFPMHQTPVKIIHLSSSSVFVTFSQASRPNGFIRLFRINVFKFTNQLVNIGTITVDNTTSEYNITHLKPFTQYLFIIESCNSIGCVQSPFDRLNLTNNNFTRTLPDIPQNIQPPILRSLNSFTVQITWSPPTKINGILDHYILERNDFKSLLLQSQSIRKYKFSANRNKFMDDNDIEPCGIYSYRLFAFNQIGSVASSFVNITVSSSKPLIVSPPVIYLVNSTSARFEWKRPVTLCNLTKYTLRIKSSRQSLLIEIDARDQFVLVTNLTAFTIYSTTLIACVSQTSDSCSNSLSRNFRTPGDIASGFGGPVAKMLSPRAVSIEWLEPELKNGDFISYQLVRLNIDLNRTENLYSGEDLYYLDNIVRSSSFMYKVIYINEFGSSVSQWSNLVNIDSIEPALFDNIIRFNFNLEFECPTASLGFIKWNIDQNKVMFYMRKLFDANSLTFHQFYLSLNGEKIEWGDFFKQTNGLVFLNESRDYNISLVIKLETDAAHIYYLTSEQKTCRTKSFSQTYNDTLIELRRDKNKLFVEYRLTSLLVKYYDRIGLVLESENKFLDAKHLTQTIGMIDFEPVVDNQAYFIKLRACRKKNCIEFEPTIYWISTLPPQGKLYLVYVYIYL